MPDTIASERDGGVVPCGSAGRRPLNTAQLRSLISRIRAEASELDRDTAETRQRIGRARDRLAGEPEDTAESLSLGARLDRFERDLDRHAGLESDRLAIERRICEDRIAVLEGARAARAARRDATIGLSALHECEMLAAKASDAAGIIPDKDTGDG